MRFNTDSTAARRFSQLLPYLTLAFSTYLVYANAFGNLFLFDDEFLIQKNSLLRQWSTVFDIFRSSSTTGAGGVDSFYRPLQTLSYLLVFQIFGLSPFGFHLLNTTFHAINGCLVFRLGQKLKIQCWASFVAALLWVLHPVHTEAVTYMSATADTMYAYFCLLSCLVLLPSFSWRRTWAATLLFVCALLSKEAAIVVPALALVCRWATADDRWRFRSYVFSLPLWATAFLYLLARKTILNFDRTFEFYKQGNIYTDNLYVRVYTFFATLPSYLELLIRPVDLRMERNFPVFTSIQYTPVWVGALILGIVFSFLLWSRGRRLGVLAFGLLWFGAAHVPHTGILIPVNSFFLEHWLYLPSVGLFLGVAGTLLSPRMKAWPALLALPLAFLTFKQNQVWATPESFYTNVLKYNPNAVRVHNNLAMYYSDQKQTDKAIQHYQLAIQISDEYAQTHYNLALSMLEMGRTYEAIQQLERAIRINPDFYYSYGRLHDIYLMKGDTKRADEYRKQFEDVRKRLGF